MTLRAALAGWLLVVVAIAAGGCGEEEWCEREDPPTFCGRPCAEDADCPVGSHCGEDGCWAQCPYMGREIPPCDADTETCDERGRCVPWSP